MKEMNMLKAGLARLERMLESSSHAQPSPCVPSSRTDTSRLPDPLEDLGRILAILPCQSDCETLFEYLLQEVSECCRRVSSSPFSHLISFIRPTGS
jgi:hypothetical protein